VERQPARQSDRPGAHFGGTVARAFLVFRFQREWLNRFAGLFIPAHNLEAHSSLLISLPGHRPAHL
jgi:hypothetical protein